VPKNGVPKNSVEAELNMLMNRLADGDRTAFEPLFHNLRPRAVRLARARVSGPLAEEVAQAALLNVFARASEFTKNRPVLPWFYAIVANEVRGAWRREQRLTRPVAADEGHAASPEDEALAAEIVRALEMSHDALSASDRDALEAMLGRKTRPHIADAAFRKRVSRATARLRSLVEAFYGD
jgi:RNA polymerase sigma-70 factor (ECF subfamily)